MTTLDDVRDAIVDFLMEDYARQFPRATDFEADSFRYEAKTVVGRMLRLGIVVLLPGPTS